MCFWQFLFAFAVLVALWDKPLDKDDERPDRDSYTVTPDSLPDIPEPYRAATAAQAAEYLRHMRSGR